MKHFLHIWLDPLLVGACTETSDRGPAGPTVNITVAPLTLPGIEDACYGVTVYNEPSASIGPNSVVWSRPSLCASGFGDGEGSVSYVGPCDASPAGRINTVSLVLNGLCGTAGCDVSDPNDAGALPTTAYQNPCPADRPCLPERPCVENADTPIEFNLTIMRPANRGFFDVAVNFEDIFCSAKLDCVPEFLHRPNGPRDLTAVLAFACTSGAAETCLYANRVTLDCGGENIWTIDPSAGPGNIPESSPLIFGAATYTGDEAFTAFQKSYWNVALGLDETLFATYPNCTLRWSTTASEDPLVAQTTPDETTYPFILWQRQIVTNGALTCGTHPLNGVLTNEPLASVATRYTDVNAPETFAFTNCEPGAPATCNRPAGFAPNETATQCVRPLTVAPTNTDPSAGSAIGPGSSLPNVYSYRGTRFSISTDPVDFEYVSNLQPGCTSNLICLNEVNATKWRDYLGNIVFSTASMQTNSSVQLQTLTSAANADRTDGFVCPTGYTIDRCGDSPVCTHPGPAQADCQ